MSPKSRGRPPGRGRAERKQSRRQSAELTFAQLAVRRAANVLGGQPEQLPAETLASLVLGTAWFTADPGDRAAEAEAARELITEVRRRPTPAGVGLLAGLARVAPDGLREELDAAVRGLPLAPPAWLGALPPEPVAAWRAPDPWGSEVAWLIAYDEPQPHVLVAVASYPGGVEVKDLSLLPLDALESFDDEVGGGEIPMPREPVPVGAALAQLREAMFTTDLRFPRSERLPDYVDLRLLAWRRVRAHADPEPPLEDWEPPRLPDAERVRLSTTFLADRAGDASRARLTEIFLDYGEGYLPEPLAWSPGAVPFFLLDHVLRKVVLDAGEQAMLVDLLAEWVRFALRQRGTADRWIDPVVEEVRRAGTEYRDIVDDESAYGPAQQLAAWLTTKGVDPTDRAAVEAATSEHNAMLLAKRALIAGSSALPDGSALRLTVRLLGVHPLVWRRIVVPADVTLDRLHTAIQLAMGWQDDHPHQWQLDGVAYGSEPDGGELPEAGVRLVDLLEVGESIDYLYDFGGGWEHDVVLDEILLPGEAGEVPRCEDGRRACPPEDIGGASGYAELLEALGHPAGAGEEMPALREDLVTFAPAAFSATAVTSRLRARW